MGRTAIVCTCGQRIGRRNITQAGLFPRPFGPSFVRVRYRCHRCRRRGEVFLDQAEWKAGILQEAPSEVPSSERTRFESLGGISLHEQAEVHRELDRDDLLERLRRDFPDSNTDPDSSPESR